MKLARDSTIWRCSLVFLTIGLATLLTWLIPPISQGVPFALFFGAVMISAWYGGVQPGLLAIALSALIGTYLFISPAFSLFIGFQESVQVATFILMALLINWLTGARQRAEAALREQSEQLRVTLVSVGDAVITTDAQGQVTFLNPVAQALTGWTEREATGQPLEKIFHIINETTRTVVENPVKKVIRLGAVVGLANHTLLISQAGREIPIDDSGAPIKDKAGHIRGVVLVFRDISERRRAEHELEQRVAQRTAELQSANQKLEAEIAERKRAEEQLRLEKEFSENLINSSFEGIMAFDQDCRYTLWNPAMEKLTGVSRAETLGKNAFEVFPFLRTIGEDKYFEAVLAGQTSIVTDRAYRVVGMNRQGYFEGHYSPLRDSSGQVRGGLAIIRDITARKEMEAELEEIRHRLIESRERDRSHLARDLHDGPVQDLYGVSFGLEAIKNGLDEPGLAQFQAVQKMLQQVIGTLRMISGELQPQTLTPFGLEKAILSHAERFQEMHPEFKIELELTPDGQTLPEEVRLTLFHIYRELLSNVAHHAGASRVRIRFSLDSEQVLLEIQDNGRGFEPPQRWVELARQGRVGLIRVREQVEALEGRLTITSTGSAGATVRVVVPTC